jgi:hypothetical protein
MSLEEGDQVTCFFDEPRLDVVAAPRWVMAIEVSRQDDACGPSTIPQSG